MERIILAGMVDLEGENCCIPWHLDTPPEERRDPPAAMPVRPLPSS
jgi:hypothetical protein